MKKEFEAISKIIENNKRVLDVGCGDGILMEHLKKHQQNDVRGLEPQKYLVQKCISKGLFVIFNYSRDSFEFFFHFFISL